ncbi:MAG: ARPP-1 family domain-containing protein [Candidatus Helarchaeota archaeon]
MTKVDAIHKFANQIINMEGLEIGAPVVLEEVTFVPIIKQVTPREDRDYLTLSEALEKDLCKIIDKGTEIAHIIFQNLGAIPILIEEGEIFLGSGTQDRICISTVLVQPNEQVEIPVKCVHAPHALSSGATFRYGGKASFMMLDELRFMKVHSAMKKAPVSTISQSMVWNRVEAEAATESEVKDQTKYTQTVKARRRRAQQYTEKLKFPANTIGLVVIDSEGEIKGLEVYRHPLNFKQRKIGIFESLVTNLSWKKSGKGAYPKAREKVINLFKTLSKISPEKNIYDQVEVEGTIIKLSGITGEVLTSKFYSSICPHCGKPKPRKKVCPICDFEEDTSEELAYMSLA